MSQQSAASGVGRSRMHFSNFFDIMKKCLPGLLTATAISRDVRHGLSMASLRRQLR